MRACGRWSNCLRAIEVSLKKGMPGSEVPWGWRRISLPKFLLSPAFGELSVKSAMEPWDRREMFRRTEIQQAGGRSQGKPVVSVCSQDRRPCREPDPAGHSSVRGFRFTGSSFPVATVEDDLPVVRTARSCLQVNAFHSFCPNVIPRSLLFRIMACSARREIWRSS